jgi:alcohol dehydrogenase
MKSLIYYQFQSTPIIENVPDPTPTDDGAIIKVKASGICRSDWHGWMGHDSDINLPHVPGHELAGTIVELGKNVKNWKIGDRVTVPFCGGCGYCPQCYSGNQQICDNYFQPGFTAWGSFAEFVAIRYADINLVKLPDEMEFLNAALLGCRFITSYRAIIAQGRIKPGEWLTIFGCGGVGLSAILIGKAIGAQTLAVDISDDKLKLATEIGADKTLNVSDLKNMPIAIKELTNGGSHVTLDALGSINTCVPAILSLRKRGRHIQVGLMTGENSNPPIPMGAVISNELEILGSHGMQAHEYPGMLDMINSKNIPLERMLGKTISLEESGNELMMMDSFSTTGVTVINEF